MDQLDLEANRHFQALRGLARINRVSGSSRIIWNPIERLARDIPTPLRVLDIATGGGDLPVSLRRRAARSGLNLQIDGCDVSPRALAFAREHAQRSQTDVGFFELDALRDPLPDGYDVICCSLFLHHLDDEQAGNLLRRMSTAAKQMVLVNDLVRGPIGYLLAHVGSRLLTRSPVVHTDAPLSVAAGFTLSEVQGMAKRAGLDGAVIRRQWPFRYLLSWQGP